MNKNILALVMVLLLCGLFVTGCAPTSSATETTAPVTVVVDSNQFSRISVDELQKILGNPSSVEKWNHKSPKGQSYPATTYTYQKDATYEFLVIDKAVVRFTYRHDDGKTTPYSKIETIPQMFGLTPADDSKIIADTGSAYRIQMVSDKVAEFWVTDMDASAKTLSQVKITYNLNYFN